MADAIWPIVFLVIDGDGAPIAAAEGDTAAMAFLHESEAQECCQRENEDEVDAGREPSCRVARFKEVTDG